MNFFSLGDDSSTNGHPYTIATALVEGGKPESLEEKEILNLEKSRLYFVNFHYQGSNKQLIAYDVCRLLLFSGNRKIKSEHILKMCNDEIKMKDPTGVNKCQNHEELVQGVPICF